MNPNKRFNDLKMKQRERIQEWLYTETLCYYQNNDRMPEKSEREVILKCVYDKCFLSRLIHFEKRILREIGRE